MFTTKKAFSLLEILLTIALIGVLMSIIFTALDPNSVLTQSKDTINKSNVLKIYTAIEQYTLKNSSYPTSIDNLPDDSVTEICLNNSPDCTGFVDLSVLIPTYIKEIPKDPNQTDRTYYFIIKTSDGDIGVGGVNHIDNTTFVEGLAEQSFIIP
jgi:prepilin-type N-terminal cleavage/methylation domain-containing protein